MIEFRARQDDPYPVGPWRDNRQAAEHDARMMAQRSGPFRRGSGTGVCVEEWHTGPLSQGGSQLVAVHEPKGSN